MTDTRPFSSLSAKDKAYAIGLLAIAAAMARAEKYTEVAEWLELRIIELAKGKP